MSANTWEQTVEIVQTETPKNKIFLPLSTGLCGNQAGKQVHAGNIQQTPQRRARVRWILQSCVLAELRI